MQHRPKDRILLQSNSLNRYIQSIPSRLQTTKQNQQSSIETKYSHLISSMKPIQLLVSKYRKKITNFINQLQGKHRINIRSKQMQELEKELDHQVQDQRMLQQNRKETAKQIRQKLNSLKIQNASIAYEIELQNKRIEQQNKKKKIKAQRIPLYPSQSVQDKRIRLLESNQLSLQQQLFNKIHSKVIINRVFLDGLQLIRKELKQSQKKCHQQGLVGSMIFKLTFPEKQNKPHQELKMNNDFRSLVYNTLKNKYNNINKKNKQQSIEVDHQRFINFNQEQTVGVLELKPEAFNILKYIVDKRIGQILLHYECCD